MSSYKSGEDDDYDYYRSDSDVEGTDENADIYLKVMDSRDDFYVKGFKEEIQIKKRTLETILIQADAQPDEQVLFSYYKTLSNTQEGENLSNKPVNNSLKNPENNPEEPEQEVEPKPMKLRGGKKPKGLKNKEKKEGEDKPAEEPQKSEDIETAASQNNIPLEVQNPVVNDPLSQNQAPYYPNNNENQQNNKINDEKKEESNVISIPNTGAKTTDDIVVSSSSRDVCDKWIHLLLVVCGLFNIIYFLFVLFFSDIKMSLCVIFCLFLGGVLVFTGYFGYTNIKAKNYSNFLLFILTIVCIVSSILSLILFRLDGQEKLNGNIFPSIVLNIASIIIGCLCIWYTKKLKEEEQTPSQKNEQSLL